MASNNVMFNPSMVRFFLEKKIGGGPSLRIIIRIESEWSVIHQMEETSKKN